MHPWVNTRDPLAVATRVHADYVFLFPDSDPQFVSRAFGWAVDAFRGRFPGYLPVDTRYHDLEHTLQGTLCLSQLLRGRAEAEATPPLGKRAFELAILAILLHDTGYLKTRTDRSGTGAKYTKTHVSRSCTFADHLLRHKGVSDREILAVQSMIRCTGMGTNPSSIYFDSEEHRIAGYALGTADLLGQMAADDYVEKLPILFEEFKESSRFNGAESELFTSAEDLMRRTPAFWARYVQPKIESDFAGLFRYLAKPKPNGINPYIERILVNMTKLEDALDELERKAAIG
jgi:hypothetical protein